MSKPAIQSNTNFDTVVLEHTTMNTGGVPRIASSVASHARNDAA